MGYARLPYAAVGDWTDFDTSSLASKVADQITGPVYDSFKSRLESDLPNIVADIRPYLKEEVRNAIPMDLVGSIFGEVRSQAIKGGIAMVLATSVLTVLGVWAVIEMEKP